MHPKFEIFGVTVFAYSIFTVLALLVVVFGGYFYAAKRGFSKKDALVMVLAMALSAFVGARVLNLIVNFEVYFKEPMKFFALEFEGFSLYGGILFAILAGFFVARKRKIDVLRLADTFAPFVGIGIAFMRVGCFLNGCCFGKETELPWGVKFPVLSQAHIHQVGTDFLQIGEVMPVHPTQIYELIYALVGSLIAFVLIRRKTKAGVAFIVFGIWLTFFRLVNHFLRVLPYSDFVVYGVYPVFYLVVIGVALVLLRRLLKQNNMNLGSPTLLSEAP